mmetsp:Transcript_91523/g.267819  ORF Transcript_91523/g.267819 Transcript_91523/m.267819 type:complete len:211 (+) Transcript_91523:1088-1720(+)
MMFGGHLPRRAYLGPPHCSPTRSALRVVRIPPHLPTTVLPMRCLAPKPRRQARPCKRPRLHAPGPMQKRSAQKRSARKLMLSLKKSHRDGNSGGSARPSARTARLQEPPPSVQAARAWWVTMGLQAQGRSAIAAASMGSLPRRATVSQCRLPARHPGCPPILWSQASSSSPSASRTAARATRAGRWSRGTRRPRTAPGSEDGGLHFGFLG